jgi:nucleoside-diphosphate-sugar epimerase
VKTIFLTGSSGFVGSNLKLKFAKDYKITSYKRENEVKINSDIVIHLAGKAHDVLKSSNPSEYYTINTDLTKLVFDSFLRSNAKIFIMLSSVKAVADNVFGILNEDCEPNPKTHYGKSKLLAESHILSKKIPNNKRVYILRPCMIHGPNNKGNLNLLYNLVSKKIPWILGFFKNQRSYCSIDNLLFIINELIKNNAIPSDIYNVADDEFLSTNEIVSLIFNSNNQKPIIFNLSPFIIKFIAKIGDIVPLPLNSERLKKLTESYMVSNEKIKKYIAKELPLTSKQGVIKTLKSFKN